MAGIKEITITDGGSGYTDAPTVTIRDNYITHIEVEDGGDGYLGGHAHSHGNVTLPDVPGSNTTTNIFLSSEASSTDDFYNQGAIYISDGTNKGHFSIISDYRGSDRRATLASAMTVAADTTTRYELGPKITILDDGSPTVEAIPFGIVRGGKIKSVVLTRQQINPSTDANHGYDNIKITGFTIDAEGSTPGKVDGATRDIATKDAVLNAFVDRGGGATALAKLTGTSIASITVDNGAGITGVAVNSASAVVTPKYTATPLITAIPSNDDQPTTEPVLDAVLTATTIGRIMITNGGSGYTSPPTVSITGGGGSSGAATVTVSGGAINGVSLTNAGSGYTGTPTISFSGGGGTGAAGEVVLVPTTIASVTVTNGGAGFTAKPTFKVTPTSKYGDTNGVYPHPFDYVAASSLVNAVGLGSGSHTLGTHPSVACNLTATSVESIKITSFGGGYYQAPAVDIAAGGGTGATAVAKLNNYNQNATNEAIRNPISARSLDGISDLIVKRQPSDSQDTTGADFSVGGKVKQKLKVGQLAMMKGGLYRVTGVEGISFGQPLGLQAEITAISSRTAGGRTFPSVTLKLTESDPNLQTITIPLGTRIIFGDGKYRKAYRMMDGVELSSIGSSAVTLSGGEGTFDIIPTGSPPDLSITVGTMTLHESFVVGTPVRIQFIPGNSGTTTNFLLDEFTVDGLDTLSVGDNEVVYHLGFGLNYTPKYIAANGTFAKAGRGFAETTLTQNGEEVADYRISLGTSAAGQGGKMADDNTSGHVSRSTSAISDAVGRTIGGATKTFTGYTSARVRVFQPKGVPRFAAQTVGFLDDTSTVVDENGLLQNDGLMINPTGFITASESPAKAPNPTYMLWIGSGEENLPQFQAAANDEDIIDPRLSFTGHKYSLRPVPEDEVKRMQRRSGGYKFEVIPYALDAYEGQTLGRGTAGAAGPRDGWSVHVKNHKGTPMNKAEYDNATSQNTPMTGNILNGSGSRRTNRGRDPRASHRRDY
tara:strand:- start:82 stop:3063 length:2982 start_codon:yes stop_codon:yes gene_type:complete